jgi:hypothetical protein
VGFIRFQSKVGCRSAILERPIPRSICTACACACARPSDIDVDHSRRHVSNQCQVATTIVGESEFRHVRIIRVQYINRTRPGTHGNVIDTVDFRQDPSGAFVPHAT